MVILCKKGTKGLDVSHGNGTGYSNSEEEVMLAPGTNFIIKDFKELGNNAVGPKWRIYLETVTKNDAGEPA